VLDPKLSLWMTLIRQDLTFSPDFTAPILAARPLIARR
jgi:hypothetical protein